MLWKHCTESIRHSWPHLAGPEYSEWFFLLFCWDLGKESNNPTFPRGLIKNHIGSLRVALFSLSITSRRDHLVARQQESSGLLTCSHGTLALVGCSYYFTGVVIKETTSTTLYSSSEGGLSGSSWSWQSVKKIYAFQCKQFL